MEQQSSEEVWNGAAFAEGPERQLGCAPRWLAGEWAALRAELAGVRDACGESGALPALPASDGCVNYIFNTY